MAHMSSRLKVLMFLLCLTTICVFLREPSIRTFSENFFQQQNANSCTCGGCLLVNNTWFIQCFNQSVELFLSAKSYLSEDDFNWWKRLQGENANFSTYRETVDMLFEIFPPNPDLLEPRPHQSRTCAVVGNSVNLKGSHYGPLIDFHDVVIRMNQGQTKGYEADVGSRTTHHIMYPESATDLDSTTHLVLFPFKIMDLVWLIKASATGFSVDQMAEYSDTIKSNIKADKNLVMVLNPAFMRYVHTSWLDNKGKYPSTGFMALVLAFHICDEVHVFGFGADENGNWSHYFEKLQNINLKTGVHPGPKEYEIIQELADQQKLKLYTGW